MLLVALACGGMLSPVASACRYSVRDTGFVDLDQPPWILRLGGLDAPRRELWQRTAQNRLRDSNLRLDTESVPGSSGASLVDARRRVLPLATGDQLPTDADAITAFIERVAMSDARDQLHDQLLRAFAVLVLIEGTDSAGAAQSRETANAAIREFTPLLKSLPKPVDTPPQLVVIPAALAAAEQILVWSLGFDPGPATDSRLAVLYGRGRRAGNALEGPLITRTAIAEHLALIGQDCECDLDRSLLQGTVFPARWDATRQAAAARRLGFDPENPLIRTEVTRIVLRGPAPGQARRSPASALNNLALGYSEESVAGNAPGPEPVEDADEPKPSTNGPAGIVGVPTRTEAGPPTLSPTAYVSWSLLGGAGLLTLLVGTFIALKLGRPR